MALRCRSGEPTRILAIRDEFVERVFDEPDAWWPDRPAVVGGRDRTAGGSWCVTDVRSGVTALVLNRIERRTGEPSRGILPLAAVAAGTAWPERVDVGAMASFNLVLTGPAGTAAWTWDAVDLRRTDLADGFHLVTSSGVDAGDPKTERFAPELADHDWDAVLSGCRPSSEPSALVVRHEVADRVYATVFAQHIDAEPGRLTLRYTRTPWDPSTWHERTWDGTSDLSG